MGFQSHDDVHHLDYFTSLSLSNSYMDSLLGFALGPAEIQEGSNLKYLYLSSIAAYILATICQVLLSNMKPMSFSQFTCWEIWTARPCFSKTNNEYFISAILPHPHDIMNGVMNSPWSYELLSKLGRVWDSDLAHWVLKCNGNVNLRC